MRTSLRGGLRDIAESLLPHAVADLVFHASLALDDAFAAEAERLLRDLAPPRGVA